MDSKTIDVTITYLSQKTRPVYQNYGAPKGQYSIVRCEKPPLHFYRYLFDIIGAPYFWSTRRYLDDDALENIIHHENNYIYVLYIDGAPAGICELDARREVVAKEVVQLRFFGLRPDCIGKNLGRWFLGNAIQLAWAMHPKEVRIETCTADHPAALPLYQKMGFSVYEQSTGQIEWKG